MAQSSGAKAFKWGCFGCLGIVGLMLVISASITGVAWLRGKNAEFETAEASYDATEVATFVPTAAALEPNQISEGGTGHVQLIVEATNQVLLVPCAAGEGLNLSADYNKKRFDLTEQFEAQEDGSWDYTVTLAGKGSGLMRALERIFSGQDSTFELCLPREARLTLEVEVLEGGLEAELGGLWLTTAEFNVDRGGMELAFREPTQQPLERLTVHTSMGGSAVMMIGNASPADMDFDYSMGGLVVDLSGAWKNDTKLAIKSSMGGGQVLLPQSLAIEGAPVAGSQEEGAFVVRFADGIDFNGIDVSRR